MAETTETCGVYTLSWRSRGEPRLACHWTYCLSSDEMRAAMAQTDEEGAPIVIRSTGRLSVDDMLIAS